ncbi:MAG: hypothetical protein Q4A31_04430 [Corynebacterium sp.]|nr:hypothetical protein [Corynebacterium sp.]MDO4761142.1 hypothetical protein [Corynebacterium sp.]
MRDPEFPTPPQTPTAATPTPATDTNSCTDFAHTPTSAQSRPHYPR